jgi:class 3 adenylate cyclase
MALVAEGFEAADKLSEIAELATRLSLIAEDRDIVVSATTLRREVLEAESLGEWRFRGLRKPVMVFRLAPSATA